MSSRGDRSALRGWSGRSPSGKAAGSRSRFPVQVPRSRSPGPGRSRSAVQVRGHQIRIPGRPGGADFPPGVVQPFLPAATRAAQNERHGSSRVPLAGERVPAMRAAGLAMRSGRPRGGGPAGRPAAIATAAAAAGLPASAWRQLHASGIASPACRAWGSSMISAGFGDPRGCRATRDLESQDVGHGVSEQLISTRGSNDCLRWVRRPTTRE